jgi:hypothetical protein
MNNDMAPCLKRFDMARKNHPIETDPIDMIGTCEKQVTPPGAFLVQGALHDTIYIYILYL